MTILVFSTKFSVEKRDKHKHKAERIIEKLEIK